MAGPSQTGRPKEMKSNLSVVVTKKPFIFSADRKALQPGWRGLGGVGPGWSRNLIESNVKEILHIVNFCQYQLAVIASGGMGTNKQEEEST